MSGPLLADRDHVLGPDIPNYYRDLTNRPCLAFVLFMSFLLKIAFFGTLIAFASNGNTYVVNIELGSLYNASSQSGVVPIEGSTTPVNVPGLFLVYVIIGFAIILINACIYRNKVEGFYVRLPWNKEDFGCWNRCKRCYVINYYTVYEGTNLGTYFTLTTLYTTSQFTLLFTLCLVAGLRNLSTILMLSGGVTLMYIINKLLPPDRLSYVLVRNMLGILVLSAAWFILYYQVDNLTNNSLRFNVVTCFVVVYSFIILIIPWYRWERLRRYRQFREATEMEMFDWAKLATLNYKNQDNSLDATANLYAQQLGSNTYPVINDFAIHDPKEISIRFQRRFFYRFSESASAAGDRFRCDGFLNWLCCVSARDVGIEPRIYDYRETLMNTLSGLDEEALRQLKDGDANVPKEQIRRRIDWIFGDQREMAYSEAKDLPALPSMYKNIFVMRLLEVRTHIQMFIVDVWVETMITFLCAFPLLLGIGTISNE